MLNWLLSAVIAIVVYAIVIYVVGRLNLGLNVASFTSALIAGAVIAIVAWLVNWLLVDVLGITFGGGFLGQPALCETKDLTGPVVSFTQVHLALQHWGAQRAAALRDGVPCHLFIAAGRFGRERSVVYVCLRTGHFSGHAGCRVLWQLFQPAGAPAAA